MTVQAISTLIYQTRKSGGSTISLTEHIVPRTGYMVGGIVDSLMFDASLILDDSPGHTKLVHDKITQWLESHSELTRLPHVFVGGWIDTQENVAYIDLSDHVENRKQAIHLGIERKELAIWDLANEAEITIP